MTPAARSLSAGGLALLAALTVFWGGNWPAMKLALLEIDPWIFRSLCLVIGGGAVLVLARAGGQPLVVPRQERGPLALVSLFNITIWHLASAYGIARIPASRAAIIAYTMPLWTVLLGRWVLGERVTPARQLALGLGLAALALLIGPEVRAFVAAPAGTLAMLLAAFAWATGTVLLKRTRWTVPTVSLTGWQLVLGAVPVVLGAVALGRPPVLGSLAWSTLAGLAYAVGVGTVFCHYTWFKVVDLLPSNVAAIGLLGIPVVGALSSAVVLGDRIGPRELAALVLVVIGLTLVLPVGARIPWGRRRRADS